MSHASDEKIAELCEFAQKHSPVFDIVTNPTAVNVKLEVIHATAVSFFPGVESAGQQGGLNRQQYSDESANASRCL